MAKRKRFEDKTIQSWPEVLKDIEIQSIPSDYVKQIKVNFSDGREWLIDMAENDITDVETIVSEIYKEYENLVDTINFSVDIDRIRADIEKRTTIFLKKRK